MCQNQEIAALEAEQQLLQLPSFDAAIAWSIGSFIQARAASADMRIAFEVSRPGQQLFFCAMPGVAPDSAAWIRRKRNVVERFHKSSLMMKLLADKQGKSLFERYSLSPDEYCSSGGGVPILVKNSGCVGAVTVSGLTQFDDHALGVAAIRSVLKIFTDLPAAGSLE